MSYCKDLKDGDLIMVAYSNRMHPAVFSSVGIRQNPRFYLMSQGKIDYLRQHGTIYRDYLTRDNWQKSIVKVNPNDMDDSVRHMYDEFINLLQEKGKL